MPETNGYTPEALAAAFADQIEAERAAARLTQQAMAQRTGIPKNTLIRYLSGERDIPSSAQAKIAAGLGVSLSRLWARAEERVASAPEPWRRAIARVLADAVRSGASTRVPGVDAALIAAALDASPVVTRDELRRIAAGMGVPERVISQHLNGPADTGRASVARLG